MSLQELDSKITGLVGYTDIALEVIVDILTIDTILEIKFHSQAQIPNRLISCQHRIAPTMLKKLCKIRRCNINTI